MNLFKEEINRSYLEHSQKGQTWGKHKYIAIKNGRYIYPEDLRKGGKVGTSAALAGRKVSTPTPEQKRSKQINDQIKSAHSNATSSKMQLTPGSELKRRQLYRDLEAGSESRRSMTTTGTAKDIERAKRTAQSRTERFFGKGPGTDELDRQIEKTAARKKQAAARTKSSEELKSIADKIKANNTSSAPKKEEKKTTTESTNTSNETAATTTSTSTETEKSGSGKGRKGSSSKKSSSKKDTTKTDTNQANNTVTPASASEEAKSLGLSDQDLKILESSIDVNSTERESVLKSLALKVIRGDFGNGEERKEKLGKYYVEIQKKVNEFMKEMKSDKTSTKETVKHSDYLMHYGVMGMKWGVRRYQNKDGSLTELGKRRLGVENVGDSSMDKRKAHAGIHANVSTDNRNVGNALNSASVGARTGAGVAKKAANRERDKKRREMDVSKMSDQDLQKAVNRMNLERNYKNLKTQDIATGKDYVADVLDTVGDVASIAASAAMIASAIYMIKR